MQKMQIFPKANIYCCTFSSQICITALKELWDSNITIFPLLNNEK